MPVRTLALTGTRLVPHAGSPEATEAAARLRGAQLDFVMLPTARISCASSDTHISAEGWICTLDAAAFRGRLQSTTRSRM